MTRIAIAIALTLATSGCDRVFGLIGDTSATDAGARIDAPHDANGDTIDGPHSSTFCANKPPDTQFCTDFDADTLATDFPNPQLTHGTFALSSDHARSGAFSLETKIDFGSMMGGVTDEHAVAEHSITTPAGSALPTIYQFEVYIDTGNPLDVTIFQIATDLTLVTLKASGNFSVEDGQSHVYPAPTPIPYGEWVPIVIALDVAQGYIDVQIGQATASELAIQQHTLDRTQSIVLGLADPTLPSDSSQPDWAVYYDDVLVR